MSSVPGLSDVASVALITLREHPHLSSPKAIPIGPFYVNQIGPADVHAGLVELEGRGLAEQRTGGAWQLTAAG